MKFRSDEMNKESFIHDVIQGAIPAAIFIALEGLYAAPVIAGDGVVILQREVPTRPAVREGAPGRVSSVDVSPDDKVNKAVNSNELSDADFAKISTGTAQISSTLTGQSNIAGLTNGQLNGQGAGVGGGATGGIAPMINGAVGGATANIRTGITGALSGLTSAIMRSSGQ
jgi:hypothetical protein